MKILILPERLKKSIVENDIVLPQIPMSISKVKNFISSTLTWCTEKIK